MPIGHKAGTAVLGISLLTAALAAAADAGVPGEMAPEYVRPLISTGAPDSNDASPVWAPGGALLAFERAEESRHEIVAVRSDGTPVKNIYYQTNEDESGLDALLPGLGLSSSYNSGLAWSAQGDRFVFMSNAGEGNYDLYLGNLQDKTSQRLTDSPQKDGQPDWSPTDNTVAFVSGRDGGAQLYLLDIESRNMASISIGDNAYLYPRWSPDGKRIAAIYGANENHDIVLLEGDLRAVLRPKPVAAAPGGSAAARTPPAVPEKPVPPPVTQRALTTWKYDDLTPSWSPDGKHVAFYTNQNDDNDPKVWAIAVVDSAGSSPSEGVELAARVVARNVIPDVHMGPAWLPDSRRIAYVRNDKQDYSPIYIVDIESRAEWHFLTGTNINHDIAVSPLGVLAFRAQVDQWDRIFLAKPPER
jgi:TolB protein